MSLAAGAEWLVRYAVLPLWVLAGLADWACHRRTAIHRHGGLPENAFHWLLLAEGGVVVLAVALLEIDTAVLALVFAVFVLHEVTTWLELRYAVPRREVRPVEQMVHSFMEVLPLAMGLLLAATLWDAAPDWRMRWKVQAWPLEYLAGLAAVIAACNVLPLAEESWRCWRGRAG